MKNTNPTAALSETENTTPPPDKEERDRAAHGKGVSEKNPSHCSKAESLLGLEHGATPRVSEQETDMPVRLSEPRENTKTAAPAEEERDRAVHGAGVSSENVLHCEKAESLSGLQHGATPREPERPADMPVRLSEPPPAAATAPAPSVPHGKGVGVPAISVVVPVYNVEKFLAECIESVLAQTFTDFELLLVDDGSPDASGKICDDFAARDSRIRVFHKQNGGVSSARNLGLQNARGEWICFVDADDILLPRALELLFAETKNFPDADIVEGRHVRFRELSKLRKLTDTGIPAEPRSREPLVVDGIEYARSVAAYKPPFLTTPWAKFIRRKALIEADALNLPREIICGEDLMMNLRTSTVARRVVSVDALVYAYRMVGTGMSQGGGPQWTVKMRAENVALRVKTAAAIFENQGAAWRDVCTIFTVSTLLIGFFLSRGSESFLKNERILPLLPLVTAPATRVFTGTKRLVLRLILLSTKFPFSVFPEFVFRAILRGVIKNRSLPGKLLHRVIPAREKRQEEECSCQPTDTAGCGD